MNRIPMSLNSTSDKFEHVECNGDTLDLLRYSFQDLSSPVDSSSRLGFYCQFLPCFVFGQHIKHVTLL